MLNRQGDLFMTAAEFRALAAKPAKPKVAPRSKAGARPDISPDIYFRSAWEANYARYLNLLIKIGVVESWSYEPETFWFAGIKRGTNSYKPDFLIKYADVATPEYVEVKGRVVPKDRTKWRRMKKYHPAIKLTIVGAKEYASIQRKWAGAIPTWESNTSAGASTAPSPSTQRRKSSTAAPRSPSTIHTNTLNQGLSQ